MKKLLIFFILIFNFSTAQNFSKIDTLKGSDTKFRNFWNVTRYELVVEPDFDQKTVKGFNKIYFQITKDIVDPAFQLDLQQPMEFKIDDLKNCAVQRDGDFIFINCRGKFKKGDKGSFTIEYSGNPAIAKNAPWDGGWVFSKDKNGNPWMSVAQEGTGVSVWLPTKDIWNDEPENGIQMTIISPKDLMGVGNGKLLSQKIIDDKSVTVWEVKNAINPYSIVPSIGKYVHFGEKYNGEKGILDLDYWVLNYNLEKAKKQFEQVKPMIKAFEYWFGPYPFYEDSYKLVETPYLGMEHQSNIAYGNNFENGYLGSDLSETGVGLLWDFIIVHESGHEWFANNITAKDQADMWIHESFTSYSEMLFTENFVGKQAASTYIEGLRRNILNDKPIIGAYGVRNEGSGDMYYKGANMLHTIRQIINDDEKFRKILRGLNKDFYHQTVTTKQIENYISSKSGIDFSTVFDQYLRTAKIPTLVYYQEGKKLTFKYEEGVQGLNIPLKIEKNTIIKPTANWQSIQLQSSVPIIWKKNYYINYFDIKKM